MKQRVKTKNKTPLEEKLRRPVGRPRSELDMMTVTMRLPRGLYTEVKNVAIEQGKTPGKIVMAALERYLHGKNLNKYLASRAAKLRRK